MDVSPGETYNLVVGAKGNAVSSTTSSTSGKSGGTSSFNGIVASGGVGRDVEQNSTTLIEVYSLGACPGRCNNRGATINGCFGMDRSDYVHGMFTYLGVPSQCFNPFENKEILASGGGAYTQKTDSHVAGTGGKDPQTGLGGGNGAASVSGNANATAANAPGCGGGSASASGKATSGAGADGAIYIYFLGVADE